MELTISILLQQGGDEIPHHPGDNQVIDVLVKIAVDGRPVVAQRIDNKRFVTLNWDAKNWAEGDMAEAEPTEVLSEHDTLAGAREKIGLE